jgi:hypothetical protein
MKISQNSSTPNQISENFKIDYSLKEIMRLDSEELSNMIFVFDPKLCKSNISYTNENE